MNRQFFQNTFFKKESLENVYHVFALNDCQNQIWLSPDSILFTAYIYLSTISKEKIS